jgi:hypothetical protein
MFEELDLKIDSAELAAPHASEPSVLCATWKCTVIIVKTKCIN